MVVKIGFIGCGRIAERHLSHLAKIDRAKVTAVSDVIFPTAKTFAEKIGAKAYENPENMIYKEELDAVYVCMPPFTRGIEESVAEQGIHLFVEKPVTLNLNLAKRIEHAISKHGIMSSVGYMLRYFDTTEIAKEFISENGPIGLLEGYEHFPLQISMEKKVYPYITAGHWMLKKEKAGEQIVEGVTHIFDLARYFAGDVSRVYAELNLIWLSNIDGFNRADTSVVALKFKNGTLGTIACALGGIITSGLKIITKDAILDHGAHDGIIRLHRDNVTTETKPGLDPYFEENRIFIEAIATGNGSAIKSTYSDGMKSLMVTLAAVQSASENKPIELDS